MLRIINHELIKPVSQAGFEPATSTLGGAKCETQSCSIESIIPYKI